MQITIPDDSKIQDQATAAGFATVEDYLMELVARDAERVAIQKGVDDFKEGKIQSFEEFDSAIRSEFGFSAKK